jgi:hypothetical protein
MLCFFLGQSVTCTVSAPSGRGTAMFSVDGRYSRTVTTMTYWGRHGHDHMVVGFTTTYAISAYHHWSCEFESWSGRGHFWCHLHLLLAITPLFAIKFLSFSHYYFMLIFYRHTCRKQITTVVVVDIYFN